MEASLVEDKAEYFQLAYSFIIMDAYSLNITYNLNDYLF